MATNNPGAERARRVTPRLFVRKVARADMAEASAWYWGRRAGLGQEFLEAASVTLAAIEAQPQRFVIAIDDIRMAPLHRFPYVIYFVELPRHTSVLAVVHGRRSPRVWQQRR